MAYTLSQIATFIDAEVCGSARAVRAQRIDCLLTDSRSLSYPESSLFFALRTPTGDGHAHIASLYRAGLRAFVVSLLPETAQTDFPEACFLLVPSPLRALQLLSERHRLRFNIPIIGITGSNGKTSIKEWIYQLLMPSLRVTRSPRSYNSQIGVPLSVWLLDERSQLGLFEAGISRSGEMDALQNIIRPTIGIFGHLGPAHQENFASLQEKCLEKLRLFRHTRQLIYCADEPMVQRCLDLLPYVGLPFAWSRCGAAGAQLQVETQRCQGGTRISYRPTATPEAAGDFVIPFTDEAAVENAIYALSALLVLHELAPLSPAEIAQRMARLCPVAMRLEVKRGVRGITLIDDAYNSDLASLDIALDFLARRRKQKRSTLILSDIQQSGLPPAELYAKAFDMAAQRGVSRLIGIGPEIAQHAALWQGDSAFFATTAECAQSGLLDRIVSEVVLLKGARDFAFERLADELQEQVHETMLEVNLSAVAENLRYYRSLMRPQSRLICMIKADGYGSGSIELARTLQDLGVEYLAVAVADEGAALRKAGITTGILVMNPEMSSFRTLFKHRLEPEVYNFRLFDALVQAARSQGITDFPVHIKLDTGMCRLGFHPEHDIDALAARLQAQQSLRPRSVFTHFVGSDSPEFDDFSAEQFRRFTAAADRLSALLPQPLLRHVCNSAAIARFPERQLDMCRLGLGLYGIDPCSGALLSPVARLRTTILQIREVEPETSVGYSRRTVLHRPSRIAAIPIGYADGLSRRLGNGGGHCLVNGQPAPYVGNICMDVSMIDVTDIPCQEGDEVEIFGPQLSPTQLAAWLDTIPYEILTSVAQRVKRVYYQ